MRHIINWAAVVVVGFLAGCNRSQQGTAAADGASGRTYYCLVVGASTPYWIDLKKGGEERARQLGAKFVFTGPAEIDPGKQVQMMEEIAAKRPAGILISPIDAATLQGPIDAATAAGI